jgi:hypothetical protein
MNVVKPSDRLYFDDNLPFHQQVESVKTDGTASEQDMHVVLLLERNATMNEREHQSILIDTFKKTWSESPMDLYGSLENATR